MEVLLSL